MVVGQSHVHHGTGHDLIASDYWSVVNGMHSKDGALRWIDKGSTHQRAESSSVGDGECSSLHFIDGDFSFLSLLGEVVELLNQEWLTSSKSWNFMSWQFLMTGTRSPVGVATATERSMKFLLTIWLPSMVELT